MDLQEILSFVPFYTWIIVGVSCGIPLLLFVALRVSGTRAVKRQQRILETGVSASATVLKAWQTNVRVNDVPLTGLLLEVTPPGREAFEVEVKKLIPFVQMARVQPGSTVPVKVDPARPGDVVLLLDEASTSRRTHETI